MSGETVETVIGTTVIETPARVRNPTTDEYQDLRRLSKDGYCRQLLAFWHHANSQETINLDDAPVLSFDSDRWDHREQDGEHILVKRNAETAFEQRILDDTEVSSDE